MATLIRKRGVGTVMIILWLGLTVSGTFALMSYSLRPGRAASPPNQWPASSKVIRRTGYPTLIMFVHPKCPCSDASMSELSVLMTHCQGRVDAHVLFVRPSDQATNWTQTGLWHDASEIPGVIVARDDDGTEARLFGVETSGDVVLYGSDGVLRFNGGITVARGHAGDNAGCDAIQALLLNEPSRVTETPVFGCDLFECSAQQKK